MKVAGQAMPHESAREHVSGTALYTDDLCRLFPGLLHAWPVTAPHAHARLLRVQTSEAFSVAGVVDVLTSGDVPGDGDTGCNRHDEPVFPDEILYHGQPVAWVLAETLEAARLGALLVEADYEPLPAILTIPDAIEAESFLADPVRIVRGDISVIDGSDLQFTGELHIGGQEHF